MKYSSQSRPSVEFKGFETPSLRAVLRDPSALALQDTLDRMRQQQPDFFGWQAVVIDLSRLGDVSQSLDWASVLAVFRSAHLHPVAVCGADESFREMADSLSLGWLDAPAPSASALHPKAAGADLPEAGSIATELPPKSDVPSGAAPARSEPAPAAESVVRPEPPAMLDAMIIDRPIRSGQQIYARDRDLVVMAVVSPGAEVIADGNVHVYGSLAGRAIAGARGRRDARIFTLDLRAEIVAVAGLYKTFEEGVPENLRGKPVQIALGAANADALEIRPI